MYIFEHISEVIVTELPSVLNYFISTWVNSRVLDVRCNHLDATWDVRMFIFGQSLLDNEADIRLCSVGNPLINLIYIPFCFIIADRQWLQLLLLQLKIVLITKVYT